MLFCATIRLLVAAGTGEWLPHARMEMSSQGAPAARLEDPSSQHASPDAHRIFHKRLAALEDLIASRMRTQDDVERRVSTVESSLASNRDQRQDLQEEVVAVRANIGCIGAIKEQMQSLQQELHHQLPSIKQDMRALSAQVANLARDGDLASTDNTATLAAVRKDLSNVQSQVDDSMSAVANNDELSVVHAAQANLEVTVANLAAQVAHVLEQSKRSETISASEPRSPQSGIPDITAPWGHDLIAQLEQLQTSLTATQGSVHAQFEIIERTTEQQARQEHLLQQVGLCLLRKWSLLASH
jgi:DNA repair exonuclease SbcCD ATPase subunit